MRRRPDIPLFEGRRSISTEEENLQCSLVEHLRWRATKGVLWWHTPNGGQRSKAQGGKLKAMGVRPGVYDLAFILADGRPAFLELKVEGGIVSKEQLQFGADCDALGVENAIAWNIDQAVAILVAWGVLPE